MQHAFGALDCLVLIDFLSYTPSHPFLQGLPKNKKKDQSPDEIDERAVSITSSLLGEHRLRPVRTSLCICWASRLSRLSCASCRWSPCL
jgi:hypothetical protein